MKIAVIAANGRSGRAFVDIALKSGHQVTAGVHSHNNLSRHPSLKVLRCDATNKQDLIKLIVGQDAVVSFIGHVKGSPKDVQTSAITGIIDVMNELDIKRLLSLTGTGVRFPGDKITLLDRILNISISIIDPNRVKDGIAHVNIIKDSDLDWSVLRVLKLQNIKDKSYILLNNGPSKPFVGRKEVAKAILEMIVSETFIKKAPMIAKLKN
jgi:hypothetical protein